MDKAIDFLGSGNRRRVIGNRCTWRAAGSALVLILALFGGQARAAEEPIVREIQVRSSRSGSLDTGFVRSFISQREGQPLDMALVRRDISLLNADQRVSEARFGRQQLDDGVRLVFLITLRYRLASTPRVEDNEFFSSKKIRDWLSLSNGDLVDEQTVENALLEVEREYRDEFFSDVKTSMKLVPRPGNPDLADLTVTIREGRRAGVRRFYYEGNSEPFPPRTFRKFMRIRAWYNPMRWFRRHQYDPFELDIGCSEIQDFYRRIGYLDATAEVADGERDQSGDVTVKIVEGPRYRVTRPTVGGVTIFPESDLRRSIIIGKGSFATAASIQRSVAGMRDFYGERGYIHTRVRPVLRAVPDEHDLVDIHFEVIEGRLTHINDIQIRGNSRTDSLVIERELTVAPGDVYNEVKVRRSANLIRNLGFFSDVTTYDGLPNLLNEDQVDLVVEVEEKYTGQFMIGAGFSSVDHLIGFAEITQGNFNLGWPMTGGGQKARLRVQAGTKRKNFVASFTEPWFLRQKLSLGLDGYYSEYDYDEYDLQRVGGSVTLAREIHLPIVGLQKGRQRASLRYGMEKISIDDSTGTNAYVDVTSGDPVSFDQPDTAKSYLRLTLSYNSRNRSFFPTDGTYLRVFGEIAGGPFGGDLDLYHAGIRARRYVPLPFGTVLSFRGRYETLATYGDSDEVPLSERLFIGGGRTLRGFEYRDVGPKAVSLPSLSASTHRPYGGLTLAMASVEYTVPVVPRVRVAAFCDVGNVWLDSYETDFSNLAISAGGGIRLDLPGFPMRLDFARALELDHEMTDEDQFVFWIGYDP